MKDRRHKQRRALAARRRWSTLAGGLQIEPLESRFVLDAVVVFNELNYHPSDSTPNLEWVELHNQQSVDVDMSGWSIGGGINYTFAEGTRISGRGYLVVAVSPAELQTSAGITGVLGPYTGALNNSGEKLTLLDNNQREMDEFEYSDGGDWPVAPDGSGASLAKRKADQSSEPAENWATSAQTGGTPGSINFPDGVGAAVQTTLLPLTASWQFNQAGVDLGTAWRDSAYDDSTWSTGTGVLRTESNDTTGSAISLNFDSNNFPVGANLAGVVAVGGWNDIASGVVSNRVLTNSSGQNTTATVSIASHPVTDGQGTAFPQLGDTRLMRGHIYEGSNQPVDVTIGGTIPFAHYDVYAYFNSSVVTNQQVISIVGAGQSATVFETPGVDSAFVQSTANSNGNYVVFHDLTLPTLVIRAQGAGGANQYGYLNGIQIVERLPAVAPLVSGPTTSYFRSDFTYTPTPGVLGLTIDTVIDDGAVFYLNGQEVYRQNMPAGAITYSTLASSPVGTAALTGPFTIPTANLLPGNNVLAVELHQSASPPADIDAALGVQLRSTVTPLPPVALPTVQFSEVSAALDGNFRVEITNTGSQAVSIGGFEITSSAVGSPTYVVPAQSLPAGGFLSLTTAQLGFQPAIGTRLFLYTPGRTATLDGVSVQDRLRGRSTEHDGQWLYPDVATFGAANQFNFRSDIVINEIMYDHQPVVTAPAVYSDVDLVPTGSNWRYNQAGADLGTAWRQPGFDASSWSQGPAPLGQAAAGPAYDAAVLGSTPVAYWRLDENPPTSTAADSASSFGAQNGAYTGVTTRPPVISGTTNAAADFNGTTSRVLGSGLNATGVFSGDWTIEGWFVHDAMTQFGTIFSDNGGSGNATGPAMAFIDTTTRLGLPAVGLSTNNVSIDLGAGHYGKQVYAVITKTGSNTAGANTITVYAYVDGVPLTPVTGTTTWNLTPNDAYQIGKYRSLGVQYFDGAIDEVAIYGRALSAAEVGQHFSAGRSVTQQPQTPLNLGPSTYYFRNEFNFVGDPNTTQLTITPTVDDGAVYYLNGVEVYRQNMPAGAVDYSTLASSAVGSATAAGPFTISSASLINGVNVLAVEVHQAAAADVDVHFDVKLHAKVQVTAATTYHESPEEWIELYNRSAQTVDLSGWRLDRVVDYVFPNGTTIAPGQYLVVAKDTVALQAQYPSIAIVGPFLNNLSNSDGRIELKDSAGNPVDAVHYYDSGNWPETADGGGSSLELRDPEADNSQGEAWAASNETSKSSWQTFTTRRIAQPYLGSFSSTVGSAVPPTGWNEFIFGLLDSGDVLVDDIRVVESPDSTAVQLIQNGTFESNTIGGAPTAWRFGGNHTASVVQDPDNPLNKVLRITSTGTTTYLSNNVETTFVNNQPIVIGREYEVSFRAKWLSGSQQLNNRAYFTLIPQTTILGAPQHNGTPGAVNSQRVANIGPTFHDLTQSPAVPAAGQSVTVSVQIADPNAVAAATLWWSTNGGAWTSTAMTGSPTGLYSGVIPGQSVGTIVQFYVQAQDGLGASSFYPAAGAGARALYEVNDNAAAPATTLGIDSYRLIMTTADSDFMNSATNLVSDAKLGATLIINEQQVIYNVGVTLKGSQHSRDVAERVGFSIEVPPQYALRGAFSSFAIDRSSRSPGTAKPSPDEIIIKQFMNHAGGLASEYDDLVYLVAPRSEHTSVATLQMARLGSSFLDSQYANGSDGSIYEYEMLFLSPGTTTGLPEGPKLQTAGPFADYDIEDLGSDKEAYRFHVQKENNRAADDFDRIIALGQAMELSGAALDAAAAQALDVDQWMRTFAARSLMMDFDGYGTTTYRHNHNMKLYVRPEDQKVLAFLFDVDGSFSLGPTQPLWPQGGPTNLTKLIERPDNLHRYYGHLQDMIQTTWNATYMATWMDHYGDKAGQDLSVNLPLVQQRADYVMSQMPAQVPFALTTNGGADFSVNTPTVDLAGNGWVNVREIRIQGRATPVPATWTTPTAWQATIPLQSGTQLLTFEAYDFQGTLIGTDTITLTSSVGSAVQTSLRITELQYHPADPPPGSPYANADFEFIELQNIGSQPIDLNGAKLAAGVQYTFGAQTLPAGGFVLVVNNQAAFESRYGTGLPIAGEFSGNLNNAGEQIQLLDSLGQIVLSFSYLPTWSATTDGQGPSLVVKNTGAATVTWNDAASWRASSSVGGSPGFADPTVTVAGRQLFYNNSKFDGNDVAANSADDAAIAGVISALLPGGTATAANYSNYSRGINGLVFDVAGLTATPTLADFTFLVGNDNTPGSWLTAPVPSSITVRDGAGVGGASRISITWPDGAIKNQWLQVTAQTSLGLAAADVFYFGNAVGETGNSAVNAIVNSTDEVAARGNPKSFLNPALVTDPFDFNRDGFVNATDQILARSNSTTLAASLKLISPPASLSAQIAPPLALATAAEPSNSTAVTAALAQQASLPSVVPVRQPQSESTSAQKATVVDAILATAAWAESPVVEALQQPLESLVSQRFNSARRVPRPVLDDFIAAIDAIEDCIGDISERSNDRPGR